MSDELRQRVVAEALSWIGTPYHLGSRVKGAGVDCGLLPYEVYKKFGLLPDFVPERLTDDWFAHTGKERYLLMVERFARRIIAGHTQVIPQPGDLVLAKVAGARVFNHSGIVTAWPRVVHAGAEHVEETNTLSDVLWTCRELAVFDFISAAVLA